MLDMDKIAEIIASKTHMPFPYAEKMEGYWICPRCKIAWPLNPHGFAVTCLCTANCNDVDATRPGNRPPNPRRR